MNIGSEALFSIVLCILLIQLVIVATAYTRRKYRVLTTFSIASYCYAFVYAAVPIYYTFNMELAPNKIAVAHNTELQYKVTLIALTGYLILICGYAFGNRMTFRKPILRDKYLPIPKYERWAYLTFFIGMLGVLIEVDLQGGVINSLSMIDSVRSFMDSAVKDGTNNPLVFFRMFKPFVIFSFYVFYLLSRTTRFRRHKFMSFVTFIISAYILFINGGRTHIFIFLVTVLIGFLFSRKKKQAGSNKKVFLTLVIFAIGVVSLIVLDPIFGYLTYGTPIDFNSTSSIDNLALQFSFPYSNMIFVLSNDFSYRFFQDSYLWLISLLPSFVTSKIGLSETPPLYEYNTFLQNNTMLQGGIPDDILTFGYYQLGITGIISTVFIFGVVISQIDKLIKSNETNVVLRPITARIIIYIGMTVMYADLEGIFRGRYDVILLLFLLVDYSKYKYKQLVPAVRKKSMFNSINSQFNDKRHAMNKNMHI